MVVFQSFSNVCLPIFSLKTKTSSWLEFCDKLQILDERLQESEKQAYSTRYCDTKEHYRSLQVWKRKQMCSMCFHNLGVIFPLLKGNVLRKLRENYNYLSLAFLTFSAMSKTLHISFIIPLHTVLPLFSSPCLQCLSISLFHTLSAGLYSYLAATLLHLSSVFLFKEHRDFFAIIFAISTASKENSTNEPFLFFFLEIDS